MALSRFELMLKTDEVYFFDIFEFEDIIHYYLDKGKHSLAQKAIELGLTQHPSAIELKLLKVEFSILILDFEVASSLLEEIEAIDATNEDYLFSKATLLSRQQKHEEAVVVLEEGLKHAEKLDDFLSMLGMEYLYLNQIEKARIYFQKALVEDPEDYTSLYNISHCFDLEKKHEESIVFYLDYIEKQPYCEIVWHQLGRQYVVVKQYEKALEAFDYAIIIDECFIGAYLEKAKTLEKIGRYKEAIENYHITLKLEDPTAFVYLRIGKCFDALKDIENAEIYYKKSVHEDPLLEKPWILLTNIYINNKQYKKALETLNKVLEIDDTNAYYWRKYSELQQKLAKHKNIKEQ